MKGQQGGVGRERRGITAKGERREERGEETRTNERGGWSKLGRRRREGGLKEPGARSKDFLQAVPPIFLFFLTFQSPPEWVCFCI